MAYKRRSESLGVKHIVMYFIIIKRSEDNDCQQGESENHQFRFRDCRQTCKNSADPESEEVCNGDISVGDRIVEGRGGLILPFLFF